MPDIKHSIQIAAAPERVFPLVAGADGFLQWWSADVTRDSAGDAVELGFFKRATVYRLVPSEVVPARRAHWNCVTGKEWSGTRLLFDLTEQDGKTLLRFTHANWQPKRIISSPALRHGGN